MSPGEAAYNREQERANPLPTIEVSATRTPWWVYLAAGLAAGLITSMLFKKWR